ncbi:endonuclease/exonuclease/phosphatase family protein [Brevibacillus dissolubilis]|uniref:endonuclease/exonuclease/phosphatase family protein n=1 Tax=Brevibacillus dissolubilis TaxID=1844116 RepID=UPI0011176348|nr:endonuclease/exonuclease/phosphatase family protein [Brevibacillus dissolubilis]
MLRVVSYNIHSGKDILFRQRLEQIAETVVSLGADVIALQEVHQNSRRGYQLDQLLQWLGCNGVFGPALRVSDGAYGNAILTRLPILERTVNSLPSDGEPRSVLKVLLNWNGRELEVWNTHLSLGREDRNRQLATLTREIHQRKSDRPFILTGDFNTTQPRLGGYLQDCAKEKERQTLPTMILMKKRVDFIYVSADVSVLDYEVSDARWSDHFPIIATLGVDREAGAFP